jgi:O-antigen/teichoic acid export membrane protein
MVTLTLAPLGFVLSALWVAAQDGRPIVIVAALVASLGLFFNGMMVIADAVLQGLSRLAPIGPAWIVGRLTMVIVTIIAVELGGSVVSVYGGQALGLAIVMAMLLVAVRKQTGPWPNRVPISDMTDLMKAGIPFAGVQFFGAIYLLADVILLEYLRGEEEVAVYRVASLAVVHLPVLSFIVLRGLYPRMAALHGKPDEAGNELGFAIHILLVISLPLAVGGMLVAEPLVVAAIDDRYASAALPMLWLLPMVPLRFVSNATGMTMNALDLPALRARGLAIAAVGNVGLNLWLIPIYGASAAAATTLAADVFLVLFQGYAVREVATGANYTTPVLKLIPALLAMTAVVLATPSMHVFIRVALGGAVYVAVVVAMRLITRPDLARLVRL